jgi:type III secretion protein D
MMSTINRTVEDSPSNNYSHVLELRVLEGAQAGARTSLAYFQPVKIGGKFSSDIVLRDVKLSHQSIQLTPVDEGVQLSISEGILDINGLTVSAPHQVVLPLYSPVRIGDATVIAVGDPTRADWGMPDKSKNVSASSKINASLHPNKFADATEAVLSSKWPAVAGIAGVVVASVAFCGLALAYAVTPVPQTTQSLVLRTSQLLRQAPFNSLKVRANADQVIVSGRLETQAYKNQLTSLLDTAKLKPQLEVVVNEQTATSVRDVFRLNGVSAQVSTDAAGKVLVATSVADVGKLTEIERIAKKDIRELDISIKNTPPIPQDKGSTVAPDLGKRFVAIVPGDAAYAVTADGTHYFPGAMIPTGHKIHAIERNQLVLEKDGVLSPLQL